VFEVQGLSFAEPGFRGCAFISGSAEARPGSTVEEVADEYRAWMRSLFLDLAHEAGVSDPERLAQQVVLVYDGAGIGAWMDRDPAPPSPLAPSPRRWSTWRPVLDWPWVPRRPADWYQACLPVPLRVHPSTVV
jgi:hypothetical protein